MSSLQFRLKKVDETRNHLIEETKHNDLMSEKHRKACSYLNYVKHLLPLASTVTGCVLISVFASLVAILVSITSSAREIKNCATISEIEKYKSIIKKKEKKYDTIVFLGKTKLETI